MKKIKNMASMNPKSPTRLVTNAFLPALAFASSVNQNEISRVRTCAHAFPTKEGQQQIVAQHQHEHGEHEQVEVDEELREVGVAMHVADGVEVDERADAGDEQRHGDRQWIGQEPEAHRQVAGGNPLEQRELVRAFELGAAGQAEEHATDAANDPQPSWLRANRPRARQDDGRRAPAAQSRAAGIRE